MNTPPVKIAFVRGSYINNFEAQNYILPSKHFTIVGFGSKRSLHNHLPFPVVQLYSTHDLPIPQRLNKIFWNRLRGDSQNLFGLESYANKFDIFHTADPHYYYSYQLARLRSLRKISSLIVTSWETIPFNNETVKAKRFIKRFTLSQVDRFICYTTAARNALITEGVNEDNISVIPLGVDIQRFRPQYRRFKTINLLTVCRLVEEKGVMEVYSLFKTLLVRQKDLTLTIVGSGPLQRPLEKLIDQDKLTERVRISHSNYEEMPKLYQSADIFLLLSKATPTWEEQYGMVIVEALATGLPVFVTDSPVSREVVGDSGYFVNLADLAGTVRQLESLCSDVNRRRKDSQLARARAEKLFDSREFERKIGTIYTNEKVAADRRRSRT